MKRIKKIIASLMLPCLLASVFPGELKSAECAPKDEIKVRFLGTGAADWTRKNKAGEWRRLSSILVNDKVLVDLTASNLDLIPQGCKPKVIFYTHSHPDHYDPEVAINQGIKKVYLSETWVERARADFEKAAQKTGKSAPQIIPLPTYGTATECGITFTALPANHGTGDPHEQALIYLLQKDNVRVLYATDTGGLPANATQAIGIDNHMREANPIHGLIMECTFGENEEDWRFFTHSGIKTVLHTANVLSKTKRYLPAEGQYVYLTHLARTLHGSQADLDANLPSPLKAAYDGLEVVFRLP